MALSGKLTGTCDNSNYSLTCEWSATQNITNNTSTITAKVYLKAPSGWSTDSSYWDVWINGTQVTDDKDVVVGSSKVLLGQKTWTVTHTSSGTCSTTISFSYSNGLTSKGTYTTKTGSGSGSITLNTIPRTSSFTLSKTSMAMGASQTVTISRASSSFTHTVQYTFGSSTTTVVTKTTSTSVSFTPPTSLASQIPNGTSGTCTVKVTTYNGNTAIGSTNKTFTLTIPSSGNAPTVTLSTVYNNTLSGTNIAGKTTVKVTPSATAKNGATIKSYTYSGAGLSGTGSSKTTGTLSAGTYTITVTATDSRGEKGSATVSFTVYAYSSPTCSISAYRTDSSGNASATGEYVRLKLGWNLSNPNNANKNAHTFKVEYKTSSATSWSTWGSEVSPSYSSSNYKWGNNNVGFSTTSSYNFRFTVTDSFSSTSVICTLSTINALLNLEKDGVGIGKIYERGKLDVNGNVYIQSGTLRFTDSPSQYARLGYFSSSENNGIGCTFISNGNNNWLRLSDDKTITYDGIPILMGTMTASGNRWGVFTNINSGGVMEVGKYIDFHTSDGDTSDYNTRLYSEGGNIVCSGAFYPNGQHNARMGYNATEACTFISNSANNWLRLNDDATMTWKGYIVHNGTSTSSDGRYKYILDNIKSEDCFNLVKNTNLYAYSLLDKSIDKYTNTTEISEELKKSSYMNIHMGIIAQEIEGQDLSRYILVKHKLNNGEYKYGVDNYAYTTAIHGALQHEIKLRENLEKEIEDLKQQIKSLKE